MNSKKKCYICSMRYQHDGGSLLDVSGFSDKTLLQVLENATCSSFEVTSINICDRCVTMLEAYEKYLIKAQSIQEKLNGFMKSKTTSVVDGPEELLIEDSDDDKKETKELDVKMEKQETHRREFKCSICKKRFKTKKTLSIHFQLHNLLKEENVICERCGGSFKIAKFQNHRIECEKQNIYGLYKCGDGDCTKTFEKYEAFTNHQRWHISERKRKMQGKASCDICGKEFYAGYKMKRHMETHTHLKAYSCPCCQSRYSQNYNMLQHMRQQHEENHPSRNMFICSYCTTTFKKVDLFRNHYEQVHGIYNHPRE